MIDTFAWTLTPTRHGDTELALIAATPTTILDPVALSPAAQPMPREPRDRVRAAILNSDAAYPRDPYRLYRLGGSSFRAHHDLAVAVTVHQLAADPPWRGLLDHIVFLAELGLDGRLRAPLPPETITTIVEAAAQAQFRHIVIARPDNTDHLDHLEDVTVITPADLRGVLAWLDSLTVGPPAHDPVSPVSPGTRSAHDLGPEQVRALWALLDPSHGTGSDRSDGDLG